MEIPLGIPGGSMSKNINVVERHGCLVCGKIYEVLAIYTPDMKLVDCTVTSSGGHILADQRQPFAVCDTHTPLEIETGHHKWHSPQGILADDELEHG